jgi:hypothetical protein
MKKVFLSVLVFIFSVSFGVTPLIVNASTVSTNNVAKIAKKKLGLLIFVSPQYASDKNIKKAINNYISSIKKENWQVDVISLTNNSNDYNKIAQVIKSDYQSKNIKASLMVGEDMNTALSSVVPDEQIQTPSIAFWSSLNYNVTLADSGTVL